MSVEKFIPITGLDNLTEQQKKDYYIQVCEHFGLDAGLNLLEYIWMDSGDGARKLVLWAKKGATDTWRDRLNISVKSLVKDEGDGYVAYTATGENEKKRQEMAVGAAETKGKAGKALADAVMTAQTRAVRRMTLQFVGGGFLDETEVRAESVTTQMTSIPSAAVVAQPTVMPNPFVGKDVTVVPEKGTTVPETGTVASAGVVAEKVFGEPVAHKPRRKRRNVVDFTMPGEEPRPEELGIEPTHHMPVVEIPQPATPEVPTIVGKEVSYDLHPVTEPPVTEQMKDILPDLPVAPSTGGVLSLSAEDKKRFEEKMKHYRNTVLPIPTANNPASFSTAGGMEPTDGLGGVAIKLRRYAEIMFTTQDLKTLTVAQWEQFFNHLDEYLEKFGAVKLVEQINGTVIKK